jgi:acyl-CoA thioesterase YciA
MTEQPPEVPGGPQLRAVAMPADANAGGSVFGGWTLSRGRGRGTAPEKITEGIFTFVAIDEEGRPRRLPCGRDRKDC